MLADDDERTLLFMDPPDHTRLRKLVTKAFTPRTVERLRPRIQELVDGILDDAAERGGMDVVADLGYELPVIVICEMLGVPPADRDQFADGPRTPRGCSTTTSCAEELHEGWPRPSTSSTYFRRALRPAPGRSGRRPAHRADRGRGGRGRHASPRRSCIEHRDAAVHRRPRDHHEPHRQRHLRACSADPDQLDRWRDDPASTGRRSRSCCASTAPPTSPGASPPTTSRSHGHRFAKGSTVITAGSAANRTRTLRPPRAARPGRRDNHHLTFSQGLHYCLGAALARLEGQVAIGSLLRRFPDLELAEQPVYRDHFVLRGLTSLQVTV